LSNENVTPLVVHWGHETGCDYIESKTARETEYDQPSKQRLHHGKGDRGGIGAFTPPGAAPEKIQSGWQDDLRCNDLHHQAAGRLVSEVPAITGMIIPLRGATMGSPFFVQLVDGRDADG